MDMSRLVKINDYAWKLTSVVRPVTLYASEALLQAMDDKVLQQITNVAQLPGLVSAATMPDAHWGYGFPIGGVAAFDADQGGVISAGGVGFDISCGIRFLRTNLQLEDALPHFDELSRALFRSIPAGVGEEGEIALSVDELDNLLREGAGWAVQHGYGWPEDLEYVEDQGCVAGAEPEQVSALAKKRQRREMGTLGSGNHYLEVQVVERVLDTEAAAAFGLHQGQIVVSIHCGSRGLGHQIGSDYLVSLAKAAERLGVRLPDRELACAPILSPEGQAYLGAMRAGSNCALANRQILTHLTRQVFADVIPQARLETLYDVSHNTCKAEPHLVNGEERTLYVHRKGATRAFGSGMPGLPERYRAVGQPVIIGGSMGTGSYVLAGTSTSEALAFSSACHGAGRAMSRHQALKHWSGRALVDALAAQGILVRARGQRGVAEEAPGAYKDVEEVALVTEQAGLARRVALLRPKVCIKG
jgi:tRNA-splicing ligase RtcB